MLRTMASKISVSSVRNSIKTILDESSGEKKRNFVETVCFLLFLMVQVGKLIKRWGVCIV